MYGALLVLLLSPLGALDAPSSDALEPSATLTDIHGPASFAAFLAGAATGFVTHEMGHVVANFALGNTPHFVGVTGLGFVPFFAISPQLSCAGGVCYKANGDIFGPGPAGMYLISTAGFDVQHIASEIILSTEPDLRATIAPYRKGWLAFNILLSVGYAIASPLQLDSSYGDASGASQVAGLSPDVFAALLVAPAVLDTYRYFVPDSCWAPWLSRAAKGAMIGVGFIF